MRGKALVFAAEKVKLGITPAYAGKRAAFGPLFCALRDHPRVCGEKVCKEIAPLSVWGSPPRMRGKVKTAKLRRRMTGITPAYAGKSRPGCRACGSRRDHPRVCGEKKDNPDEWSEVQGSPPRMRGKVNQLCVLIETRGITPAYAGKRGSVAAQLPQARDHPRVCGEKQCLSGCRPSWSGSPPRMRGKD